MSRRIGKEIAALSTRGRQRIVPGAHHLIADEQPQAVVGAITEILNEVRP